MQITDAQSESMTKLVELGFAISHFYADGIVRMAIRQDSETVGVFVRQNGSVSEPNTSASMIVSASLRDAGIR